MTFVFIFCQLTLSEAAPIKTSGELTQSEFCKKLQCAPSSPYRDKNGETAVSYRLKDSINFDLFSTVDNGNLKKITFKFINEEGDVDKQLVTLLLTSTLGRTPDNSEVEKIIAAAKTSQSAIWTHDKKLLQAYQLAR